MEKKRLVELLKDCGAVRYGKFVLTSGAVSDYYIDIKKASTRPDVLKEIAEMIKPYLRGYDVVAGMELGAVPLATALSLTGGVPMVIIRKEKRVHGTRKQIEGEDVNGKKVLVVEDVTTSGGSALRSVQVLRNNGAIVDRVITVVDRQSGAKEKFKKINVELISLLSVSDILLKK